MTDQQLLIHHRKVMIEEHLSQLITVKDVCIKYRVSRTTFYKWFGRYLNAGESGLVNKVRSNGRQPNQISEDLEKIILEYSYHNPAHGPMSIYLNLRRQGIKVGKTAIYNTLKRHGLNLRKLHFQRLQLGENKVISKYLLDRELAKSRLTCPPKSDPIVKLGSKGGFHG
jgi:transposase